MDRSLLLRFPGSLGTGIEVTVSKIQLQRLAGQSWLSKNGHQTAPSVKGVVAPFLTPVNANLFYQVQHVIRHAVHQKKLSRRDD